MSECPSPTIESTIESTIEATLQAAPRPWWREPMLWLVIGGPAAVVVAGIVTAVIAVQGADTVIAHPVERSTAEKPAVQARNHAASPPTAR